ncbi:hypothetical protein [Pseudonocardia sp. H11422]|uniref:hypothetical protein n=1 Tax=Pseudonocardia sp. H11422 TaxID=2835866 RepID=UPI001BDD6E1C|nr:hypothetical protein [Pseudonocardia sp. H11422]
MCTSTPPRLSAAAAEHLLDGGDGPQSLRQLLAAAAGPGTASELRGEAAARAAFVACPQPLPNDPTLGTAPMRTRTLSRILMTKVIAALALTGAAGGVAIAATATAGPPDELPASAAEQSTEQAAPALSRLPEPSAAPGGGTHDSTGAERSGTPSPSLPGLCRAWSAGATDNPGRAAENPAFTALVAAAGDPSKVDGYCAGLTEDHPTGRPTTAPGNPDHPTGPPADAPGETDHPTGPPADAGRPGGAPQLPEQAGHRG